MPLLSNGVDAFLLRVGHPANLLTLRSLYVPVPLMTEWGELSSKVVRLEKAGQEVLARAGNIMVARAAFDVSVSLYQTDEIELRQGSRVICSSKRAPD
jgi:hypothetical protein